MHKFGMVEAGCRSRISKMMGITREVLMNVNSVFGVVDGEEGRG